jgi:capsular polysaccharide transport system permease protein
MVILPLAGAVYYLEKIAHDQYSSSFGFAVRSEDLSTAQSLLGGLASLSGTSSSDTDILFEFIQSRSLVESLDERLDLITLFSKPENDPVFAFDPEGSIEDLVAYWNRMVHVGHSSGAGLIEVRVNAFAPEDAFEIAQAIVDESSVMINELSTIARTDATRYALLDLDVAMERLRTARQALTRFRSQTRIVDPRADIQGQMGLLNSLQQQLADAVIEMNLLRESSRVTDPRVEQSQRRIAVIESLIEQERAKFGLGNVPAGSEIRDYSVLVGEFERLSVDVEYAEKSFLAAQALVDAARAEAQRKSRYLATFAKPSMPQSAQYPKRVTLTFLIGSFLLLVWSVCILIYYSLRERH